MSSVTQFKRKKLIWNYGVYNSFYEGWYSTPFQALHMDAAMLLRDKQQVHPESKAQPKTETGNHS